MLSTASRRRRLEFVFRDLAGMLHRKVSSATSAWVIALSASLAALTIDAVATGSASALLLAL